MSVRPLIGHGRQSELDRSANGSFVTCQTVSTEDCRAGECTPLSWSRSLSWNKTSETLAAGLSTWGPVTSQRLSIVSTESYRSPPFDGFASLKSFVALGVRPGNAKAECSNSAASAAPSQLLRSSPCPRATRQAPWDSRVRSVKPCNE